MRELLAVSGWLEEKLQTLPEGAYGRVNLASGGATASGLTGVGCSK
jgi:hypothetical protein